jgi:hypothetical protein
MAFHGPSYGLSRECAMKSQAKFDLERAQMALDWCEEMVGQKLDYSDGSAIKDSLEFGALLKDGSILCQLINRLRPGSVKKINTMKAPFKQRENIELFVKGCEAYGLKAQDLFQVNDLYENKNLYMIVDNIFLLGGHAQKNGFSGPLLGVKVAKENKREFDESVMKAGQSVIGLQYGSNKGASQAGMTAYGTGRQIRPDGEEHQP